MQKMIDWWTVRGEKFGILNLDFKVELESDEDARVRDFDCYSESDEDALDAGDWQFVTVAVTPVDRQLNDLPHCAASLSGVEWGTLGENEGERTVIDRDKITESQVDDLLYTVVDELARVKVEIEFADDSPYRHVS